MMYELSRRFFNTTGPCFPERHYLVPPLKRLYGVEWLIARGQYFVIHAPRQSGKTTYAFALMQHLNQGGVIPPCSVPSSPQPWGRIRLSPCVSPPAVSLTMPGCMCPKPNDRTGWNRTGRFLALLYQLRSGFVARTQLALPVCCSSTPKPPDCCQQIELSGSVANKLSAFVMRVGRQRRA